MKKYVCGVCGYTYDAAKGDSDGNIPAGTAFEDLSGVQHHQEPVRARKLDANSRSPRHRAGTDCHFSASDRRPVRAAQGGSTPHAILRSGYELG